MINNEIRHEIVSSNPDIEVRFYLSVDEGSYVAPHWHNSLELVYMLEGSMTTQFENNVRQTIEAGEISVVNPRVIHSFGHGSEKQGSCAADTERPSGKIHSCSRFSGISR